MASHQAPSSGLELVRDYIPARVRIGVYGAYLVTVLIVGSIDAFGGIDVDGVTRVLMYLSAPITTLAAVNVTVTKPSDTPDEGDTPDTGEPRA